MLASIWLAVALGRRGRCSMVPVTVLRSLGVAAAVGVSIWLVSEAIDPRGRVACLVSVGGLSLIGVGAYALGVRLLGANITLNPRGWVGSPTIESARG